MNSGPPALTPGESEHKGFSSPVLSSEAQKKKGNMSSLKGADIDPDADFVYDYHTLRVGGLAFAGIIVFLSIILLAGNKIRNCGKSKPRQVANDV
ncbi:sodium/potassium-transporting ATPase subunit gamma-like [Gouania willdenowi]|uniref:FXYD domain-containing ion transport regulator n=1 Tax=Gouania willdenowi TaxID=441366 RepID=A0A8C5N5G0_GOUWI|nr:sodium/potassium-transporting ATPase subunit gamma-like [Gouania willdenowi]